MTLPIYLFALLFCPDLVHSQGQISFAPGSTEIEILAPSTLLDPFFVHETLGTHTDYDARVKDEAALSFSVPHDHDQFPLMRSVVAEDFDTIHYFGNLSP